MKKVLFLHGWSSDGGSKSAFMRSLGYDVHNPNLSDWFLSRAVRQAQAAYDKFQPDVIVGSSRGGTVALVNTDEKLAFLLLNQFTLN